jgi:hypothetical protein
VLCGSADLGVRGDRRRFDGHDPYAFVTNAQYFT